MKRIPIFVLLFAVVILGPFVSRFVSAQVPIVEIKQNAYWEYRIERDGSELIARINRLGKEGWELASVIDGAGGHILYFKRIVN